MCSPQPESSSLCQTTSAMQAHSPSSPPSPSPLGVLTTARIVLLLVPAHVGYAGALIGVYRGPSPVLSGHQLAPESSFNGSIHRPFPCIRKKVVFSQVFVILFRCMHHKIGGIPPPLGDLRHTLLHAFSLWDTLSPRHILPPPPTSDIWCSSL